MNWFIFTCRPASELRAKAELETLDMNVLLPMGKRYVSGKHRKRARAVTFPLWQGYIVGGADVVDWPELRRRFSNRHCALTGPLTFDGEIRAIGPALVEEIRNRSWIQLKPFDVGDRVQITKGAFAQYTGTVIDLTDSSAQLVLDILGKSVPAAFEPSILRKAA